MEENDLNKKSKMKAKNNTCKLDIFQIIIPIFAVCVLIFSLLGVFYVDTRQTKATTSDQINGENIQILNVVFSDGFYYNSLDYIKVEVLEINNYCYKRT